MGRLNKYKCLEVKGREDEVSLVKIGTRRCRPAEVYIIEII